MHQHLSQCSTILSLASSNISCGQFLSESKVGLCFSCMLTSRLEIHGRFEGSLDGTFSRVTSPGRCSTQVKTKLLVRGLKADTNQPPPHRKLFCSDDSSTNWYRCDARSGEAVKRTDFQPQHHGSTCTCLHVGQVEELGFWGSGRPETSTLCICPTGCGHHS